MNINSGSSSMENRNCAYCFFLSATDFEVPAELDQKIINNWIEEANILESDKRFTPLKTVKLYKEDLKTTEERQKIIDEKQSENPLKPYGYNVLMVAHGTKIEYAQSIIKNGFLLREAKRTKHGKGVYFSDLFHKTSMYSALKHATVCDDCLKTQKCCAFISAIPTQFLKKEEGEKSVHRIKIEKGEFGRNWVQDEYGRFWGKQIPLAEGVDRKVLYEDDHFNEIVVSGEQFEPLYLVIVEDKKFQNIWKKNV